VIALEEFKGSPMRVKVISLILDKFKTYYGGFVTIFFMMGLIAYTGVSIRFLINKSNPTITS